MKNRLKYIVVLFSIILFASSCHEDKITITNEYVINPNWDKQNNLFGVYKLRLIDKSDTIDINKVNQTILLSKLKKDNHLYYNANIVYNGTPYSERKVYFSETIGELEQNSWYLLDGLSDWGMQHYIYIDSLHKVHKFTVNQSNW